MIIIKLVEARTNLILYHVYPVISINLFIREQQLDERKLFVAISIELKNDYDYNTKEPNLVIKVEEE